MIPNPFPGKFFVFEGIDGCGKTTQLSMAAGWLNKIKRPQCRDYIIKLEKEPGKDRFWGSKIYEELEKPKGLHTTNLYGFQSWNACDSKDHMQKRTIRSLRVGGIVLMDRYRHSLVFGVPRLNSSAVRRRKIKKLVALNLAICGEYFILPDAAFIFDICPETAITRLEKKFKELGKGDFDGHEKKDKLEVVRSNYLLFARMYPNCYVIDAEGPAEQVFEKVKTIIEPIIKQIPTGEYYG